MELAPDVEQPYVFVGKITGARRRSHAGTLLERFEVYQKRIPRAHLGYFLAAKAIVAQGG